MYALLAFNYFLSEVLTRTVYATDITVITGTETASGKSVAEERTNTDYLFQFFMLFCFFFVQVIVKFVVIFCLVVTVMILIKLVTL